MLSLGLAVGMRSQRLALPQRLTLVVPSRADGAGRNRRRRADGPFVRIAIGPRGQICQGVAFLRGVFADLGVVVFPAKGFVGLLAGKISRLDHVKYHTGNYHTLSAT